MQERRNLLVVHVNINGRNSNNTQGMQDIHISAGMT
jgi:hypothetical protein